MENAPEIPVLHRVQKPAAAVAAALIGPGSK